MTAHRGQVTFTLHFGTFQVLSPAHDLFDAGSGHPGDILNKSVSRAQAWAIADDSDHGSHLSGGSPSDAEEVEQFGRGGALKTFSDVVGDGQRGSVELIAKAGRKECVVFFQKIENPIVKGCCFLPGGKVFKTFIGHKVIVGVGIGKCL